MAQALCEKTPLAICQWKSQSGPCGVTSGIDDRLATAGEPTLRRGRLATAKISSARFIQSSSGSMHLGPLMYAWWHIDQARLNSWRHRSMSQFFGDGKGGFPWLVRDSSDLSPCCWPQIDQQMQTPCYSRTMNVSAPPAIDLLATSVERARHSLDLTRTNTFVQKLVNPKIQWTHSEHIS